MRKQTAMEIFPKIAWRIYRYFALFLRDSNLLNYHLGRATLRQLLGRFAWFILRRTVPNPVQSYGHIFYHTGQGNSLIIVTETHEPETVELMRRLLEPGMTLVDVGAHIGLYTILGAAAVGQEGRVYAFEPNPLNIDVLVKNIKTNGYGERVKIVRKAIANKSGVLSLFLGEGDTLSSSIYATHAVSAERVEVEAVTLDQFFQEAGWPSVHVIKIDIEGAEKIALEGMREFRERNPTVKLIIEFCPLNLRAARVSPQELFQTLHSLGFGHVSVISRCLTPVATPGDVIRNMPRARLMYVNLLCES